MTPSHSAKPRRSSQLMSDLFWTFPTWTFVLVAVLVFIALAFALSQDFNLLLFALTLDNCTEWSRSEPWSICHQRYIIRDDLGSRISVDFLRLIGESITPLRSRRNSQSACASCRRDNKTIWTMRKGRAVMAPHPRLRVLCSVRLWCCSSFDALYHTYCVYASCWIDGSSFVEKGSLPRFSVQKMWPEIWESSADVWKRLPFNEIYVTPAFLCKYSNVRARRVVLSID